MLRNDVRNFLQAFVARNMPIVVVKQLKVVYIIAVRLRGNKKVQNLSSMWYKKLPQQLATQGDFGLEPSYYTLLSTAIPDTGTCF